MSKPRALILAAIAAAAALAGCQRYRPAPLDAGRHDADWAARDPASPDVADFARRLMESNPGPETSRYDQADGLTLREAEIIALFFNPQLRAARAKARVAAVGAAEAGRWEDPALNVDAERIIESVQNPWVLGGTLAFTLPLSGRLGVERDRAAAEADVGRLNAVVEEQAVLAELRQQWVELAAAERRAELTRQYLSDLGRVTEAAGRLQRAGELGPIEAKLFRIEQLRRTADLRALELQQREQAIAVKALMGLTPSADVRVVAELPRLTPAGMGAEAPPARLSDDHPRLVRTRAEYAVAERALELEVRRQYPDVTVGGGYGVDEGTHRILGGLSVPLPLFNANRRAIAEARANRDAARAGAEATYEELVTAVARAELAMAAARARRELLERDVAPLVDEQLRDARQLGRLGAADTVVLLEALTRAHEARLEVLDAASKEAVAVERLNALVRPTVVPQPAGGGAEEKR